VKSPWTALFPCPVVLATCVDSVGKPNIITLAWAGVVCSDPPMLGLSIRPYRYSFELIDSSGEFVVNIPTVEILRETDFCGMVSGKDVDKFSETGLTPEPAEKVKPPLIRECPVNIECVVKQKVPLGVHHLLIGEVVCVHVDQAVLNENERIDFSKISAFVYNQREYWSLQKKIGVHGFTKQ
jgi:flavin reductase (DIM6/NTAB) family NADH-FMN oxidoreductase RutF